MTHDPNTDAATTALVLFLGAWVFFTLAAIFHRLTPLGVIRRMSDRMTDPLKAILHPAFVMDCERCGAATYVRAARFEGPPPAEAPRDYEGDWLVAPEKVECIGCGKVFETSEADS